MPLCEEVDDIERTNEVKKQLKATVKKLVQCVSTDCKPTMDALRIALQVSTKQAFK